MSQYLSAFAVLMMVMSPLLIPAIITAFHHAGHGLRAVGDRRRTELAASPA